MNFEYYSANNKADYLDNIENFLKSEKKCVFEVFTDYKEDSNALKMINNLDSNRIANPKKIAKNLLGDKGVNKIKNMINKI